MNHFSYDLSLFRQWVCQNHLLKLNPYQTWHHNCTMDTVHTNLQSNNQLPAYEEDYKLVFSFCSERAVLRYLKWTSVLSALKPMVMLKYLHRVTQWGSWLLQAAIVSSIVLSGDLNKESLQSHTALNMYFCCANERPSVKRAPSPRRGTAKYTKTKTKLPSGKL